MSATLHRILGPENQVGEDLLLVEEESLEQGGLLDVDDLEGDEIAEAEVDAVIQLPGGEVLGLEGGPELVVGGDSGGDGEGVETDEELEGGELLLGLHDGDPGDGLGGNSVLSGVLCWSDT